MNTEETILRIERKMKNLIQEYQAYRVENSVLKEKIKLIEELVERQKNSIKDLEEKNNLVKIADSIPINESDNKKIKLKISQFVKEIDECIALLSK